MEKISTSSEYDDFLADLPENECRWALYDHEFKNDEGSQCNELIFYQWYISLFSSSNDKGTTLPAHKNSWRVMKCYIFIYLSLSLVFACSPQSL